MYYGTPPIVTNGLILNLDAANHQSYISGSSTWNDLSRINNGINIISSSYSPQGGGTIYRNNNNGFIINNYNALKSRFNLS